jgi:hypothetical protein
MYYVVTCGVVENLVFLAEVGVLKRSACTCVSEASPISVVEAVGVEINDKCEEVKEVERGEVPISATAPSKARLQSSGGL